MKCQNGLSQKLKSTLIAITALIFLFDFSFVVFAGCDLVITDIAWSPANPVAGDEDGTHAVMARLDDVRRMAEDNWDNKTYTKQLNIGGTPVTPAISAPTPSPNQTGSQPISSPTPRPNLKNRGATVSYVEYEAESAVTSGTVLRADRTFHIIQSEASGRKAVRLDTTGQYVEFTLTQPANSIVIRYCMPDAPGGGGIIAPISLYINGVHSEDIPLTSKYAWVYGAYPWSNDPGQGNPHRFFDETRAIFKAGTLGAGTKVRLQKDAADTSAYYIIDLIDMENVGPALTKPADFLSITDYGAVPDGSNDNTKEIKKCIAEAKSQGKGVWIPAGTFNIAVRLKVDNVTIRGAGMWYSVLTGTGACFALNGNNCKFYDFALYGDTTIRDDSAPETGFDGNAGTGSVIQNIWMEHLKCGIWVNGPTNGLVITGCRIRNTFADGINLCSGTCNTTVSQCTLRNTGDDSIAIWSATWMGTDPCKNNVVRYNTIQCPWLANGLAVYGGADNKFEYNVVYDTISCGAGINISSNFDPVPFSGTVTVQYNTLIRTGSYEPNLDYARGAIWIWCAKQNIAAALKVNNNDLVDSTYQGIFIEGPYRLVGPATFSDINISQTGTYGIDIRKTALGTATFQAVTVTGAAFGRLNNEAGGKFIVEQGTGNSGWE